MTEETGFSRDRCNTFRKLARKVRADALALRGKKSEKIRALLADPDHEGWTDDCRDTLAAHLVDRFDSTDIKGLMMETGFISPPAPAEKIADDTAKVQSDFFDLLEADDALAAPLDSLFRLMDDPVRFEKLIHTLPLEDTEIEDGNGGRRITGLRTLRDFATRYGDQLDRAMSAVKRGQSS